MKTINTTIVAIFFIASCQFNSLEDPIDCNSSDLEFTALVTDAECSASNGTIDITAIGGEMPYSYSIDGDVAQSSPLFESLAAGEYVIKVTDNLGCSIENTVFITNINGLSATATSANSDCGTTSGSINVLASNGAEPYQYQLNNETPQSVPDFTLGPGNYDIIITDANGCEFSLSQIVNSNTTYQFDIQPIIANSCALAGCHNGSNSSLPNFNNISEVQANASMIRSRTQSGNMPRGGSLTQEQIDFIACWIDDGALNN